MTELFLFVVAVREKVCRGNLLVMAVSEKFAEVICSNWSVRGV